MIIYFGGEFWCVTVTTTTVTTQTTSYTYDTTTHSRSSKQQAEAGLAAQVYTNYNPYPYPYHPTILRPCYSAYLYLNREPHLWPTSHSFSPDSNV